MIIQEYQFPTQKQISKDAGLSILTVKKALEYMQNKSIIRLKIKSKKFVNRIFVNYA